MYHMFNIEGQLAKQQSLYIIGKQSMSQLFAESPKQFMSLVGENLYLKYLLVNVQIFSGFLSFAIIS